MKASFLARIKAKQAQIAEETKTGILPDNKVKPKPNKKLGGFYEMVKLKKNDKALDVINESGESDVLESIKSLSILGTSEQVLNNSKEVE